jgi:asparagine synthase (glutamine-hydrolysing)
VCGLIGELRFDGREADVAALDRASRVLAPRGPDGSGMWAQGPVGVAHRRLAIIDLSPAGAQPMVDPDTGTTAVFNGCIYNHHELRAELRARGHRFASTSDTEVVIKAHAEWGTACVEHLVGMFAFALVERASGRLVLARDRLGIKPLYLDRTGARLRFASDLRALLAAGGVDTTLDRTALAHYMSFHSVVPPPRTILTGVRKLPPATVRVVEADGSTSDTVYWAPSFTRDEACAGWGAGDWQEALLERLRVAVERRMVADVPVGVLLSGGIDSSLIVGLLAEAGQQDLATFSIGFEEAGGERGDEFAYSDLVAAHFGTDHHRIRVDTKRLLPGIDAAVAAMAEPMVSHDCVAFHLLSEDVSAHVKVVQSGQGADEILAGYDWYPPLAGVPDEERVAAYASVFADRDWDSLRRLLNPDWLPAHDAATDYLTGQLTRPGAGTAVDAALRHDTLVNLVDDPVKRVDNMTMAWGLEARVPFLDHEVVELAARIPPELKLASGGKGVLKDASRGIVPDAVIDRTKGSFPVPAIRQLEGAYLERAAEALHDPAARERGLFRPERVEAMLAAPNEERTTLGANALWQLALLEMWLQANGIR